MDTASVGIDRDDNNPGRLTGPASIQHDDSHDTIGVR
jgi:hypothetical protein